MIKIIDNYLTYTQCQHIINLWNDDNTMIVSDGIYHFYGFNLIPHLKKVINIIPELSKCNFKKFRIQYTDEDIIQVANTHTHLNPYSFVIFLNDNFNGGELIFNEITITPKIGTMVYFTGDE